MVDYPVSVLSLLVVRDFFRRNKLYSEADTLRNVFTLLHLSLCDDQNGHSSITPPKPKPQTLPSIAMPLKERNNARARSKLHRRQRRRDVKSRGRDFAEWIMDTFCNVLRRPCDIIDVAGGKGEVTYQLATHTSSEVSCTVVDPVAFRLSNAKTKALIKSARDGVTLSPSSGHAFDISKFEAAQYHPMLWQIARQLNDVRVLWLDWYGVIFPHDNEDLGYVEEQVHFALQSLSSLRIRHHRDYFIISTPTHLRSTASRFLIALHPDEATEDAIDAALEHQIPFAIVPCCVFPSRFPHRVISTSLENGKKIEAQVRSLDQFLDYLQAKHMNIRREVIDSMLGPNNVVLYMQPEDYEA